MPGRKHELKPSTERQKRKTSTSRSCKGPAVRITKENQPEGNSMIGKKKKKSKTKRGKYSSKQYFFYITMQKQVLLNI